ncbi:c-type cytochrome domain-containing protein, partial [uncultured Gimesia sp.]|uniref:c-type cytochrome domain-containing protein n=1 Tax=uncultured Gimesia sp. TaxID=1678688 RepID=UPI00260850BC
MNNQRNQTRVCFLKAVILCTVILCMGISAIPSLCVAAENLFQQEYQRDIVPLFSKFCFSCHDEDTEESGLKLSGLDGSMNHSKKVTLWKKIHKMVESQKMPPQDVEQLSQKEIAKLTSWIEKGYRLEKKRLQTLGNRHKIRRLTNREFNSSLLGLVGGESSLRDFTEEENIPQDAVSKTGFSNDVEANHLTKTHLKTFKKAALAALQNFSPYLEKPADPLHYFYNGEYCYTCRATQDHVMDFVKNVAHPMTEVEFQSRREIMNLKGNSFLGRPLNKAVWGPGLFAFKQGPLKMFDNNLLLANAVAFPASQMHSRGQFQFRIRVRGKPDAAGNFPRMRIKAGYFDVFANNFKTLDSVQLTASETIYEFEGNIRDFPYLDSVPAETTYRNGNVPKLTAFDSNDWYNCLGAFFIVLVENASRHEKGLDLHPGHHRRSLGNIHIGSFSEIMERARTKTLANYYMQDSKLVE